ncbi:hypothetical protein PoB_003562300 [Plakobranchus ocellatus]|uniref:Uncharacterized protein n=1 Tax=Plakobranchus ocellatus TaxID=259542 RepID=A0AAV4ARC7_9GAST|nr:hypothetical protein PoB_003562300 [Plakobranchus ocellatus]
MAVAVYDRQGGAHCSFPGMNGMKQPALGVTPAPLSHHGASRHSPSPRHWGPPADRMRCMPSPSVSLVLLVKTVLTKSVAKVISKRCWFQRHDLPC